MAERPIDWSDMLTELDLRALVGRPWIELENALIEAVKRLAIVASSDIGLGPSVMARWWARSCAAAYQLNLHRRLDRGPTAEDFAPTLAAALEAAPQMGHITASSRPDRGLARDQPSIPYVTFGAVVEAFAIEMAQYVALHDDVPAELSETQSWLRLQRLVQAAHRAFRSEEDVSPSVDPWRILRQETLSPLLGLNMVPATLLVQQLGGALRPPEPLDQSETTAAGWDYPVLRDGQQSRAADPRALRAEFGAELVMAAVLRAWHTSAEWSGTLDLRPFLQDLAIAFEEIMVPELSAETTDRVTRRVAALGHYLTSDRFVPVPVAERYDILHRAGRLPRPVRGGPEDEPPPQSPLSAHSHAQVLAGSLAPVPARGRRRREELLPDQWLRLIALRTERRTIVESASAAVLAQHLDTPLCVTASYAEAVNLLEFLAGGVVGSQGHCAPIDDARAAVICMHRQLYPYAIDALGGMSPTQLQNVRERFAAIVLQRPGSGLTFGGGHVFKNDPFTFTRARQGKPAPIVGTAQSLWESTIHALTPPFVNRWRPSLASPVESTLCAALNSVQLRWIAGDQMALRLHGVPPEILSATSAMTTLVMSAAPEDEIDWMSRLGSAGWAAASDAELHRVRLTLAGLVPAGTPIPTVEIRCAPPVEGGVDFEAEYARAERVNVGSGVVVATAPAESLIERLEDVLPWATPATRDRIAAHLRKRAAGHGGPGAGDRGTRGRWPVNPGDSPRSLL